MSAIRFKPEVGDNFCGKRKRWVNSQFGTRQNGLPLSVRVNHGRRPGLVGSNRIGTVSSAQVSFVGAPDRFDSHAI